jgi:hypothetical protein
LQTALDRATVAEAAAYNNNNGAADNDLEQGRIVRNRRRKAEPPTLRRALLSLQGGSASAYATENSLGQGLDAIDDFLTKSGKILRYNPLARLFFGTYNTC